MRTEEWDRETFRKVLEEIRDRTQLTDAGLAELSGRSRSQVNRWNRAENQPDYESLRRLVAGLDRFGPKVRSLGIELLAAAGYAPPETVVRVSQPRLTVPEAPSEEGLHEGLHIAELDDTRVRVDFTVDTDTTMDDVYERLGDLSPNERALIANMEALDTSPSMIGGAVLMLREFNAKRAARKARGERREA